MDAFELIEQEFFDDYGPHKLVHIHEPKIGLKAIVCIHNCSIGRAIGGCRMAPDVTTKEVYRLAQGMTHKNAAAGLPHGGGKSAIIADHKQPEERREELIRAFARAIKDLVEYVPGPDMGTDERSMGYVYDVIGRAVGLPRALGGIPLDEIGATGYGVCQSAIVAAEHTKLDLNGATIAIEGFGNVGKPVAKFLAELGCVLVAASDTKGTIYNPNGIDPAALIKVKNETGSVINFEHGKVLSVAECLTIKCDILVPSARPDCINEGNWDQVQAKLIVPGANIPAPVEIEAKLHDKGILNIPDFIANAGGVICGAVELNGGRENDVFPTIKHLVQTNTQILLDRIEGKKEYPRDAAVNMANERVKEAMQYRK